MLTAEEIARLESFDAQDARVLSTYLDLRPDRQVDRGYRVVFHDLVEELGRGLEKPARHRLDAEAAETQAWLEKQVPRGLGLALFSCAPRGFWDAYYLPVRVPDQVVFEPRPEVAPLLDLVDEYERYAVALVDKEKARLFTAFLGSIEESDAFEDFVPHKSDQGGLSQGRYQRHHEAHVHWHLRRVADRLAGLLRRRHFDRLIVAGPEEATSMLRGLLSRPLASRLAAVVPAEVSAGEKEILDRTLEVERGLERQVEEKLLAGLFERADGGGRAVYGVGPTLDALWAAEVQTLVLADQPLSGAECPTCGRTYAATEETCALDETPTRPLPDLTREARRRALEQAASVEFVHGHAAEQLAQRGGGLGALLRFRMPLRSDVGRGDSPSGPRGTPAR
jgi:peptide subunit release factor 1 (eRF1)